MTAEPADDLIDADEAALDRILRDHGPHGLLSWEEDAEEGKSK